MGAGSLKTAMGGGVCYRQAPHQVDIARLLGGGVVESVRAHVGRWSAEIYLLFAEGRPDIWPAGDLAVMAGIGRILKRPERPDEAATRALAEPWRPHRGALACFAWHCYDNAAL